VVADVEEGVHREAVGQVLERQGEHQPEDREDEAPWTISQDVCRRGPKTSQPTTHRIGDAVCSRKSAPRVGCLPTRLRGSLRGDHRRPRGGCRVRPTRVGRLIFAT
jgi:hypothetical protein